MNESSQTTTLQESKVDPKYEPRVSIEQHEDFHPTEPPNPHGHLRPDGKRELTEDDAFDILGYSWPSWRKWQVLSVIFAVQVSMNFNASVFPNAVPLLADHFGVSLQAMRVAQMVFLVAYAFGSELWAPWSEELGRWPILQCSLFLVNSMSNGLLHSNASCLTMFRSLADSLWSRTQLRRHGRWSLPWWSF